MNKITVSLETRIKHSKQGPIGKLVP